MRTLALSLCIVLSGCTSVANVKDFPASSAEIDFDDISVNTNDAKEPSWNTAGSADYLTTVESESTEELIESISKALQDNGYRLTKTDYSNSVVFAERGIRPNEYDSVAGVYFKPASGYYSVYARVDISQSFTGGWQENRAKKIIDSLCLLATCKPSPTR